MERIVLLGAGRMGGAMLRGWLAAGIEPGAITVIDPAEGSGEAAVARVAAASNLPDGFKADTLVVAVKPQFLAEAVRAVSCLVSPETLVVSVAAGTTIATLSGLVGGDAPVVRSMPNLPAQIGRGITAAVAGRGVGDEGRRRADRLLSAIGAVVWLDDEGDIDAVTAVSGSGPAYVFHLCECLEEAARSVGLSPDLAARLARETVIGAGALLEHSAATPAALRRDVTSPGGTTEAALKVLAGEGRLGALVRDAVLAARERSRQLS